MLHPVTSSHLGEVEPCKILPLGQAGGLGDQLWYFILKSSELRSQTSWTMVLTSHKAQICFQRFCTQI